ncbi:hypothetical protein N7495_003752 [Penicillium taxi]|uniref:uncharacterized protein n=1 Tax=Penicillium taxi TaxID=168475 RepID=UPI00254506A9|nr:uncharacterized protein N7495_003752 [Penicillium taxi]KAJ5899008.1 hypothetical protein N7495_003752 [Penicillium taxi]
MALDEAALQAVANGGSISSETWSATVASLLERFEYIVYNEFPMPTAPPVSRRQQQYPQPVTSNNTALPESSNKENDVPGRPRTPPPTSSFSSTEHVPDSQPQTSDSLPPALAQLITSTRASIQNYFANKPPHTIQRLAELILYPKRLYKTLPAYLRAVDRVVSVTSPADIFPFPTAPSAGSQANGVLATGVHTSTEYTTGLGSDESLGGALLTPIPWLTSSSFEGEPATAILDPEELGAINSSASSATLTEGEDAAAGGLPSNELPEEEVPHARGPSVLGVEDMGLQNGKGVELSLGEQAQHAENATNDQSAAASSGEAPATTDTDGDIVLSDTISKTDDTAVPQEGEKSGADVKETST